MSALMRVSIGFVCLLLWSATAAGGDVPDVILNPDGKPYWVSADVALDVQKKFKPEALGDYGYRAEERLRFGKQYAAKPRKAAETRANVLPQELKGCKLFSADLPEHSDPTSTLSDLVEHAEVIVDARVVGVRQGFLSGGAGSLLVLDATYLKGTATRETYLFYPLARIETSEGLLCTRPLNPNYLVPKIGDRMIVFSMLEPRRTADQTILWVNPARELVHGSAGKGLVVPPALDTLPRELGAIKDAVLTVLHETR